MKDNNIDQLLLSIGEETSLESMREEGTHIFSFDYNQKKEQLFADLGMVENELSVSLTPSIKNKKIQWKVLMIAAVLLILSSMTVFAAVKIFCVTGMKDSETGTYTYFYEADEKREIPEIKIHANYIPEGYTECTECGEGKYHLIEDNNHKTGFSIIQSNQYSEEEILYVSSVKNIEINGIKTDILTREGVDFNHVLLMFYEEQGYVFEIYAANDISIGELKKIAENITFELDTDVPDTQVFAERETDSLEETLLVNKEQIISIGDEISGMAGIDLEGGFQRTVSCKVTNLEIRDTLPEGLDKTRFNFRDGLDTSIFINEDGSIKPYKRETSKWENNELRTEAEEVKVKCIDVTLSMTNIGDKKLTDIGVSPSIYFLNLLGQETYTDMPEGYVGNLTLDPFNYDRMPFYFDKTDNPNDQHFYFMGMEAGEIKEVRLLFALEEDLLENAYIDFRLDSDNSYYLKIQE